MKKIDFTNPILGRRWLSLFDPSLRYGLLFKKALSLHKTYLGFSFVSNHLGLRGPCETDSKSVLSGTSFAMGMSVDAGKNWYELTSEYIDFFNMGMPVSIVEQNNVIDDFFTGERRHLVFIYHPNFWVIAKQFFNSRSANKDISEFMSWSTSRKDLPKLILRWAVKTLMKRIGGKLKFKSFASKTYKLDTVYSKINVVASDDFVKSEMDAVNRLLDSFDKVSIIRVPIKEQVFWRLTSDSSLKTLIDNYDANWDLFVSMISRNVHTADWSLLDAFSMSDYLPYDTHWNVKGNKVFHDLLTKHLNNTN